MVLERSEDIGRLEVGESCLLEIVVRMRRLVWTGRRSSIDSWSCDIEVSDGIGRERVGGSPRPGKVVTKTLTRGAIFVVLLCDYKSQDRL